MEQTNIADLKSRLSDYLKKVQEGHTLEICKRNLPIARIVPIAPARKNRTVLGCGSGTVVIEGDLTEPVLKEWEMISGDLV